MKIFRDRFKLGGNGAKSSRIILAALMLLVSTLQGLTLCVCDSESRSCGDEHCHESHRHGCHNTSRSDGEQSLNHDCAHLKVVEINALVFSGGIDPQVAHVLSRLAASMIRTVDFESAVATKNQYLARQSPPREPPHFIYISNFVKVLR